MSWKIDNSHSHVQFSVRHMGLSTVRGHFTGVDGRLDLEQGLPTNIEATIDVGSVDTREERRDQHLRSADFFHAEEHPQITFRSRRTEPAGAPRARVVGDLTIRGVTREVVLDVEASPVVNDPWGLRRVGFEASGTIDRKDFGLTWNQVLEFGSLMVGDQVRIQIDAEAVEEKAG